jgi:hypothetical protein
MFRHDDLDSLTIVSSSKATCSSTGVILGYPSPQYENFGYPTPVTEPWIHPEHDSLPCGKGLWSGHTKSETTQK